jgi:hypothetical protein
VERTALERPILLLAVLWYLITAWFSTGYLHGDEHYQILEFAGSIAGWNRPEDLAWEHAARIRPALQPILAYLFLSGAEWSGLSDPFVQAFLLRAISGLLAVFLAPPHVEDRPPSPCPGTAHRLSRAHALPLVHADARCALLLGELVRALAAAGHERRYGWAGSSTRPIPHGGVARTGIPVPLPSGLVCHGTVRVVCVRATGTPTTPCDGGRSAS